MFSLSAGIVSYKTALNLLEYTKNETEARPMRTVQHNIEYIKRKLQNTPAYEGFKVTADAGLKGRVIATFVSTTLHFTKLFTH